ncbi:hypothetical protein CYK37_18640 [Mesorhizobium loti]|nr:DUF1045 domain-containing protein [Mesorhizobium loti]PLP57631.1 hypothetical protein CYK37_18640 [Mesorhizobium loti]
MRYAVYFTPSEDDPLTRAASNWLGRDAFSGELLAAPSFDGLPAEEISRLTGEPRRYGFHATIVAPFRPADGIGLVEIEESFDRFCAKTTRFFIEGLRIGQLGSFLALLPTETEYQLSAFAADAVLHFAPVRAALTEAEIERRDPSKLNTRQSAYLRRHGYPFVMDEFRFHMTLSERLPEETLTRVQPALERRFEAFTGRPFAIDGLALFVEREPGAPFTVHSYRPLRPVEARKSA